MFDFIYKMIGDKREYKEQMSRVETLPGDYRFVFEKLQKYMWQFASGDGMDMLKTQYELITLFESGAAEGKHVLEITGNDVVGFCDELMRDTRKWQDNLREKLNSDVSKLGEGDCND